jgi:hypothetical protein
MLDEVKDPSQEPDKAVADKPVTDADLDAAHVEVETPQPQQEVAVPEPVPQKTEAPQSQPEEEPVDPRERSNLGRKVKRLEDELTNFNSKMDTLLSRLTSPQPQYQQEDEVPDIISTSEDVLKLLKSPKGKEAYKTLREDEAKERETQKEEYERKYFIASEKMKDDNPDMHKEIFDEMLKNFNLVRTGTPEIDAELNYIKAKASLLSKRMAAPAKPKPPNVKGDKNAIPAGLNVGSTNDAERGQEINLDADALEFLKKTGMSMDSAKSALKGDVPMHLVNKR